MREISPNKSIKLIKVTEFLKKHNIEYKTNNEPNGDAEIIVNLMPLNQSELDLIVDFLGDKCNKECESKLDYYENLVFWEEKKTDNKGNNNIKDKVLNLIEGNASLINNYYFMRWDTSVYNEVSKECGECAADRVSDLFSSLDSSIDLFFEAFGSKLKDRILEEFKITACIDDKDRVMYIISDDRQRLAIKTLDKIIYADKNKIN